MTIERDEPHLIVFRAWAAIEGTFAERLPSLAYAWGFSNGYLSEDKYHNTFFEEQGHYDMGVADGKAARDAR